MRPPDKGRILMQPNGRIIFANMYFCGLVRIPHSDVAGMSLFNFVFSKDLDAARLVFKFNKHLQVDPFSIRLKKRDGVPVWVDIHFDALKRTSAVSATISAKTEVAIQN